MSDALAPLILIADDDDGVRALVAETLTDFGAIVTAVADGAAAVTAAATTPFDACVLDVEMPVMNGLEACRRIRGTSFSKELPILILTGRSDQQSIDAAFDSGAWDFLNKPVHGLLLWRRISNMLTLSKIAQEAKTLESLIQLAKPPSAPPSTSAE